MEYLSYEESKRNELITKTVQAAYEIATNQDKFSLICPFCGGKLSVNRVELFVNFVRVTCSGCDVNFSFDPTEKIEYYYE